MVSCSTQAMKGEVRYRLSPNEAARVVQEEKERRRKLRIVQVNSKSLVDCEKGEALYLHTCVFCFVAFEGSRDGEIEGCKNSSGRETRRANTNGKVVPTSSGEHCHVFMPTMCSALQGFLRFVVSELSSYRGRA